MGSPDLHRHGIWELEGVEEGVGDDRCPGVGRPHLHEAGEHLGPEHAPVAVGEADGAVAVVSCVAGLDAHVELACCRIDYKEINFL